MRYAMGIEYDGRAFFGWQRQRQEPTVQSVLEAALGKVADHPVQVACAGRTDTGVHARCQVAHFDTESPRSARSWMLGVNSNLPDSARLRWITPVSEEFHARFSALGRSYEYVILNRWIAPAIEHGLVSWCRRPLDAQRMHEAGQLLLGEHDFSAFRSSGCKANHPVRDMQSIAVHRQGEQVRLEVAANGFLYHMVRNIAGSLISVGTGERDIEWFRTVLQGRDRRKAGITADPNGLYFVGVRYPLQFELPGEPPTYPDGFSDGVEKSTQQEPRHGE